MSKHLLVAIADINHIDQAKQLFSSVYWNAGWEGDYMLMAHNIPEDKLVWFRKKGIIVRLCGPIHNGKASGVEYPEPNSSLPEDIKFHMNRFPNTPAILNKFELFTPEFRKWDTVLYLDCDIIVRYSLDRLTKIKGFTAVSEYKTHKLKSEFHPIFSEDKTFKEIKEMYNMNAPAFNSGVMAFSTDIIKDNSFDELKKLFIKYHKNCNVYGEQPIINLYFYKNWKRVSVIYNVPVVVWNDGYKIPPKRINGVVLHFFGNKKPWLQNSPFFTEWHNNLKIVDNFDLKDRKLSQTHKRPSVFIKMTWFLNTLLIYGRPHFLYKNFHKFMGICGSIVKKVSPMLYEVLGGKNC